MAAVTYDKIETNSYTSIFTLIDTRANVADPRNPDGVKRRQFVYDFDPFHLGIQYEMMPYIIVELPDTAYTMSSLDQSHKGIDIKQRITVRTIRGGSGNTSTDMGRSDMLNICDDLHQLFNTRSKIEDLHGYKMSNAKLTKLSSDMTSIDQKYIYETVYELTYKLPYLKVVA